jgi:hypothetical protein
MTRYTPLWQQAGTYPASVDRGLLSTLWPTSGSSGGAVTTVANTMTTSVAPGTAAVALTSAANLTQLCRWDAAEVVTHAAAPPAGSSRIDLVVLQVRDNTLDAGGNNDFIFQAIAGAGGTPGPGAVPAVPTNAYPMGQLTVPGGAANLNGVTVVDRRVPMNARDGAHSLVYRNGAWTTPTTQTLLTFDTVVRDGLGLYSSASGLFTCPVAGVYLVNGEFSANPTAANQWADMWLYRNGAQFAYGTQPFSNTTLVPNLRATLTAPVYCAAGDTLALWVRTAVALTGTTGQLATWGAFDYLGTG